MMIEETLFLTLRGGVLYFHRCRLDITTAAIVQILVKYLHNS